MKEKAVVNAMDSDDIEADDSSDEDNHKLAYEEWKARELKRLLRDREELRVHEQD
jgi:hypothetical protein